MPSLPPIRTCRREENPENTERRIAYGDQEWRMIWGWVIRRAAWPENLIHISACEDGIVHLVGYLTDATQILPALEQWHNKRRGNADEWEHDGV